MKRNIAYQLFLFLCGTTLLLNSCSDSNSKDDETPSNDEITSFADLKALFDKGEVTHIDFETVKQRVLLDEEIESMTIVPNDDIFGFELLKIVTMSPPLSENTPDALRQRNTTSLTFSEKADPMIVDDKPAGFWSETVISVDGNMLGSFTPRAYLFDSEITTAGLVILEDKLRMKFTKK